MPHDRTPWKRHRDAPRNAEPPSSRRETRGRLGRRRPEPVDVPPEIVPPGRRKGTGKERPPRRFMRIGGLPAGPEWQPPQLPPAPFVHSEAGPRPIEHSIGVQVLRTPAGPTIPG